MGTRVGQLAHDNEAKPRPGIIVSAVRGGAGWLWDDVRASVAVLPRLGPCAEVAIDTLDFEVRRSGRRVIAIAAGIPGMKKLGIYILLRVRLGEARGAGQELVSAHDEDCSHFRRELMRRRARRRGLHRDICEFFEDRQQRSIRA